jgi:ABC-type uncharacterized transport system auxiliary subunit
MSGNSSEAKLTAQTIAAAFIAIVGLFSAACATGRPIHYYSINPPPAPAADAKPNGLILVVGHIATPETLEDGRINYRAGNNEVGAYALQRWVEPPGVMVRDLLIRDLRGAGAYRLVQEASSGVAGDYLLRGKLEDFSELDTPGIRTRVSLQLELIDRKSGLVVWNRHFDHDEPVEGKTMKEVVASLDHSLQQVISEAVSGIGTYLSGRS